MRKFRGKTKTTEGEKWIYGFYYEVKSFFDNSKQSYIRNNHILDTIVISETVGQSTGLKDKNGVEIYEGDIVLIDTRKNTKGIVEYSNNYASYIITKTNTLFDEDENIGDYLELEVIGNIYDNKELLEE